MCLHSMMLPPELKISRLEQAHCEVFEVAMSIDGAEDATKTS